MHFGVIGSSWPRWAWENADFPETHWDKLFLPSTLQKLQELQARAAVVSSLGTLQDDDSDLEGTAVQVRPYPYPSHPSLLCAPALGMSDVSLGSSRPRNGTKMCGFNMATPLSVGWVGKGTAFAMADILQGQGKAGFLQARAQSGARAYKNCPLAISLGATSPWLWNTSRDGDSPPPWAAVPAPWHLTQKRPGHFPCDLSSSLQTKLLSANKPKGNDCFLKVNQSEPE